MSSTNGKKSAPSKNGRKQNGQFAKGWKGGTGNPWAKMTHRFKVALINSTTKERRDQLIEELWNMALEDPYEDDKSASAKRWAMQQILDRVFGKPEQTVSVEGVVTFAQALATLRPDSRDAPVSN